MARWRAQTKRDVGNFDGCGFGKYWVISFRLALLMPLKPSHNLLVRGSNPCGGTNYLVSAPTFLSLSLTLVIAVVHLVLLLGKIGKNFSSSSSLPTKIIG